MLIVALLDERGDSVFLFCFVFAFRAMMFVLLEKLLQLLLGRHRRRWKLKAGKGMDELLRRTKSLHRPCCKSITEKKMLIRLRICQVFLPELLGSALEVSESKERGEAYFCKDMG